MSKKIKKVLGVAAPIVGGFLGPGGAIAGGALGGALSGGGLKGALLGGATAGASSVAGKALSGSGLLGSLGGKLGAGGMGPPTPGTGILGALSKAGSGLNSLTGAGSGGLKSILSPASTLLSGVQSYKTQDDMEKKLLESQRLSKAALDPYAQAGGIANEELASRLSKGFAPGDLSSDPGYQFRLEQGQKGINRSLGAQGSLFSGKALKAASEYGQGVAASEYDNAYKRWLEQNNQLSGQANQGLQAARGLTGIYDNQGNIGANAALGKSNVMTGTLSRILSGSGNKNIIGYRKDGTPIYDDQELVDA